MTHHGLTPKVSWCFCQKIADSNIVSRNYLYIVIKKSLFYISNHRILKLPMSLYCKKKFNRRFLIYCKIITIKDEGLFFSQLF